MTARAPVVHWPRTPRKRDYARGGYRWLRRQGNDRDTARAMIIAAVEADHEVRARTLRQARRAGPSSIEWHLERLPPTFDHERPKVRVAAALSARRAYYAGMQVKSAQARKR